MDPRMVKIGKDTTEKERKEILALIREFRDTFAWNYDDLKAYRGDVIQHTIPLVEGAKPFRQKLRHINPKLASQIQKELQKMVDAGIIAPIRYSCSLCLACSLSIQGFTMSMVNGALSSTKLMISKSSSVEVPLTVIGI
jgi:hypothetical protein